MKKRDIQQNHYSSVYPFLLLQNKGFVTPPDKLLLWIYFFFFFFKGKELTKLL